MDMTRIKLLDLPGDMKIGQDEMKKVLGGIDTVPLPDMPSLLWKAAWTTRTRPLYAYPIPLPFPRR
jgi:hypothetical protein